MLLLRFELLPVFSEDQDHERGGTQTRRFPLPYGGVHLWHVNLDAPAATVLDLAKSLSDDERERAARFRFTRDRRRFVVGRGFLRHLISNYIACEPADICFEYGPFGKPSLVRGEPDSISFNLSHSESLAVFGFARGLELGVDVERVDRKIDVELLASQFFAEGEIADINARPLDQKCARFFEIWTRKEALIKAQGKGLTALCEFDVSICRSTPVNSFRSPSNLTAGWAVRQFIPAPRFVAALAVSGGAYRATSWDVRWSQSRSSGLVSSQQADLFA